jgi:septum formation inhibitor-activating ATPase MinD
VHSPWASVHFPEGLKMIKKKRVPYNNMLDRELIKNLKILAAKQEKKQNDLLEEAMQDLLKKYEKKGVLIRSLLTH